MASHKEFKYLNIFTLHMSLSYFQHARLSSVIITKDDVMDIITKSSPGPVVDNQGRESAHTGPAPVATWLNLQLSQKWRMWQGGI